MGFDLNTAKSLVDQPSPLDEVYADYPQLKKYGFQFRDSPAQPGDIRKLEFYRPGESESPFADKSRPGIERFDKSMGRGDILGDMFHYLPSVDPQIGAIRKQFQTSISPEQATQWLRGDYEHEIKSGVYGKTPPSYAQWLEHQGGDALFRGYLSKQFPEEAYTPDQVKLFGQLSSYLKTGSSQSGFDLSSAQPINSNGVINSNGANYGRMTPKEDQPGPDMLHKIIRQGGIVGRAALEGTPSLGLLAGDLAMGPYVRAQRDAGQNQPYPSEAYSELLTKAGAPIPQTPGENLESAAVKGATGAIGTMGAGSLATNPVVRQALTSNPVLQTVSGTTGGVAGEVAKQSGAGPGGQLAASIAGASLPSIIRYGGPALIKWLLRGGEEGRQAAQDTVDTFAQAGTTPSVGQATGSRGYQATESLLSRVPGGAGPMADRAIQQQRDLADKVESMASDLAPNANPEQAGRLIEKGITGKNSKNPGDSFMVKTRAVQKILYDKLDDYLPENGKVSVDNTKAALERLTAPIPGAENISSSPLFTNNLLDKTAEALRADLGESGAKYVSQGTESYKTVPIGETTISGKYIPDPRGPHTYKTVPPSETSDGLSLLMPEKPVTGENITINPKRYVETEIPPTGNTVMEGRSRYMTPGGIPGDGVRSSFAPTNVMPYQALKEVRSRIGEKLTDFDLSPDVPKAQLKQLYGALSADMEQAAKDAGPDAYKAFQRANGYTSALHDRIDLLQSVIDKNGGPEKIFTAATSGTKDGATVLRAVMKSLPEDGQKMLSASILRRMGRALPGAQNEAGDVFSTERFLTAWNTMSPEAKTAAFSRYGSTFAKDMDALASIASNLRSGSKVFANPSGTAQVVSQQATWFTILGALATGHPAVAGTEMGLMGTANLAAKALTNPKIVNWMVKTTEKPIGALPAQINTLAQWAKNQNDPDAQAIVDALKQAEQSQNAQDKPKQRQ